MILVDYSGVVFGILNTMDKKNLDVDIFRHKIVNSLRVYNKKYRDAYGDMVLCLEGRSWRREVFPEYKFKRREASDSDQDTDTVDWEYIYGILSEVTEDIRSNLPWKVIRHPRAEADDIIGALALRTGEFGQGEPVMIVSGDHDFIQLHRLSNVKQYSPITKKLVKSPSPRRKYIEHIVKGDAGDGIPNINMADKFFVESVKGSRQKSISGKFLDAVLNAKDPDNPVEVLTTEQLRNFIRNKRLVDLSMTPPDIVEKIYSDYDNYTVPENKKVLPFLIKHNMNLLIDVADDFFRK